MQKMEQFNRREIDFKEIFQKWFQKDRLILLILGGILLFVIALPVKKDEKEIAKGQLLSESDKGTTGGEKAEDQEAYEKLQEEKLKNILSSMDGVGKVEVMLTFISTEEQVIEKEVEIKRNDSVEKDSAGGSREISEYEKGSQTVYQTRTGENIPYVVKTLYPRVEGVLVVAEGAGNGKTNRSITEVVQALFGVEVHRIKVVPMESNHISKEGLIQ